MFANKYHILLEVFVVITLVYISKILSKDKKMFYG